MKLYNPLSLANLIRKKSYTITVIAGCCLFAIIGVSEAYAVDMTIGATSWCSWAEQKSAGSSSDISAKSDPSLLFGPTLSVKISESFNLTFVYLYGKFNFDDSGNSFKSKRSDADLALNYRLSDYFKLFAGAKYLSFDMMQVEYIYGSTPGDISINDSKHEFIGAGFGVTGTFPILENLFLLATLSGFSGWGTEKVDVSGSKNFSFNAGINDYGINSTLSMAYYITSASTVISLGGRYQYFKTKYAEDQFFPVSIKNNIYGITLSAAYSFNI